MGRSRFLSVPAYREERDRQEVQCDTEERRRLPRDKVVEAWAVLIGEAMLASLINAVVIVARPLGDIYVGSSGRPAFVLRLADSIVFLLGGRQHAEAAHHGRGRQCPRA
eukprot:6618521-Prymnesium_polylepis.2